MEYVYQIPQTRESKKDNYRFYSVKFDFCYLELLSSPPLTKALAGNLSRIKLVQTNHHLGQQAAILFLNMLASNFVDLNFIGNILEDNFAATFSACLRKIKYCRSYTYPKTQSAPMDATNCLKPSAMATIKLSPQAHSRRIYIPTQQPQNGPLQTKPMEIQLIKYCSWLCRIWEGQVLT